jgi:hypothetical protein
MRSARKTRTNYDYKILFKAALVSVKIFIASVSSLSLAIATGPGHAHAAPDVTQVGRETKAAFDGSVNAVALAIQRAALQYGQPVSGLSRPGLKATIRKAAPLVANKEDMPVDAHVLAAALERLNLSAARLPDAVAALGRSFHVSPSRLSSEYLQIAFHEGGAQKALQVSQSLGSLGRDGIRALPREMRETILAQHLRQAHENGGNAGARSAMAALSAEFGSALAGAAAASLPSNWFADERLADLTQISPAAGDEAGDDLYNG